MLQRVLFTVYCLALASLLHGGIVFTPEPGTPAWVSNGFSTQEGLSSSALPTVGGVTGVKVWGTSPELNSNLFSLVFGVFPDTLPSNLDPNYLFLYDGTVVRFSWDFNLDIADLGDGAAGGWQMLFRLNNGGPASIATGSGTGHFAGSTDFTIPLSPVPEFPWGYEGVYLWSVQVNFFSTRGGSPQVTIPGNSIDLTGVPVAGSPVPEPATGLLAIPLVAILWKRRRA